MSTIDTSQVSTDYIISTSATTETEATGNIQRAFALMQIQLAELAEADAQTLMDEIEALQSANTNAQAMIDELNALTADSSGYMEVSDELLAYMDANDISYSINDYAASVEYITGGVLGVVHQVTIDSVFGTTSTPTKISASEQEAMISAITTYQSQIAETSSTSIQQKMIFLEDCMGKYNSYLTGANSTVSDLFDTISAITNKI